VSASGVALPPFIIYPRKRAVPDALKADALPGTVFKNSKNGWITQDIYLAWLKQFLQWIPPQRPSVVDFQVYTGASDEKTDKRVSLGLKLS